MRTAQGTWGGVTTVIVALVMLVVLAGIAGCRDGADPPSRNEPPGAPDTTASKAPMFQSPTGNMVCVMSKASGVRCDIREREWHPPPQPSSCDFNWANGMELRDRGPGHFSCISDAPGPASVLVYGKSIRRGRYKCLSSEKGMRCFNRSNGHGFLLSREVADGF